MLLNAVCCFDYKDCFLIRHARVNVFPDELRSNLMSQVSSFTAQVETFHLICYRFFLKARKNPLCDHILNYIITLMHQRVEIKVL